MPEVSMDESVFVVPDNFVPLEYDIHNNIPASLFQCFYYVYGGKLSILDFHRSLVTANGGIEEGT
jgi:hypothetical protein